MTPFASLPGNEDAAYPIMAGSPPPTEIIEAGVPGEWRYPPISSTVSNLTAADVTKIVDQSLQQEKITRAAIRLPVGIPARMQIGVTDIAGNVLGLFRTNDATMFSLDIVIQKGRTRDFVQRSESIAGKAPARQSSDQRKRAFGRY